MSDGEEGEDSHRRLILDALGFQLSVQFWVAVLSGIVLGGCALLVSIIR